MKRVIINDLHQIEVESDGDLVVIDGLCLDPDLYCISENHYHLIIDHKSYRIEVTEKDERNKTAVVQINNRAYRVKLRDEKDQLIERLGMETNTTAAIKELKAPMPGLVLDILVDVGQQLQKGDHLLVLEAMKMENLIKSPLELIVKSVEVKKGDKIEKNQILLYFE